MKSEMNTKITIHPEGEDGTLISLQCNTSLMGPSTICDAVNYIVFDEYGIPFRNGLPFDKSDNLNCHQCQTQLLFRTALTNAHESFIKGGRTALLHFFKFYGFPNVELLSERAEPVKPEPTKMEVKQSSTSRYWDATKTKTKRFLSILYTAVKKTAEDEIEKQKKKISR